MQRYIPACILCLIFVIVPENYGEKRSPSIVIVGAGPAGIAAASRLLQNNFENVTILEAENRIGGRIYSVFFGEAFIDLGAQWCHGRNDNVVYELANEFNILRYTDPVDAAYLSTGRQLDNDFVDGIVEMMLKHYTDDIEKRDHLQNTSMGLYYSEQFNNSIYEKFCNDSEKLKDAKLFRSVFEHFVISSEGSFSWFDSSLINDYKDSGMNENFNWNGFGYQIILDILMQKFPNPSKQLQFDERILLNKEVSRLIWHNSTTNTVEIECSDNTKYQSDHVIFTPSIGVLKETHKNLFSPMLPVEKQKAIDEIEYGAVMKILVYYQTKWWDDRNFTYTYLVWTEEDKLAATNEFPEGPIKNGHRWVTDIFSFHPADNNPNVLLVWVTGQMVPEIELLPNDLLCKGLSYVLNKFFGHKYYEIPKPDAMLRSGWYSNPHFRGTYSYQTVNTRKGKDSAENRLAKPLEVDGRPIILFAGEASHPYYYSTVHGAIETGFREADRIIELYK